jgi:hypothetical protein
MPDPSRTAHLRSPLRRVRAGVATALAVVVLVVGTAACGSDEPGTATATTAAGAPGGDAGTSTSSPSPSPSPSPRDGDGPGSTAGPAGPLPEVELDEREQAYVDALMTQPTEDMSQDQAACIAGHWVEAIGVEVIEAGGVTPESIRDGSASINDIPADRATAEKVVAAYEACEFDLTDLVISGFASMAQDDPAKLACLESAVTDEVAREYMILAVMASATEGNPDLVEIQRVIEPCVT